MEGLPNTDYIYSRILSLPVYAGLSIAEQKTICEVANSAASQITPGTKYLRSNYLKDYLQKEE